jgi:hypothetical protein
VLERGTSGACLRRGNGAPSKVEATGRETAAALPDAAAAKRQGGGEQIQLPDFAPALRTSGKMSLVTTKEAAQILGATPVRVRQLIKWSCESSPSPDQRDRNRRCLRDGAGQAILLA